MDNVTYHIKQLIHSIILDDGSGKVNTKKLDELSILNHVLHEFSTHNYPQSLSAIQAINKLERRLISFHRYSDASRLKELFNILNRSSKIETMLLSKILSFLCDLYHSKDNSNSSTFCSSNTLSNIEQFRLDPLSNVPNVSNLFPSSLSAINPKSYSSRNLGEATFSSSEKEDLTIYQPSKLSSPKSSITDSSPKEYKFRSGDDKSVVITKSSIHRYTSKQFAINNVEILIDMLYVLQGIDGKVVFYGKDIDGFRISTDKSYDIPCYLQHQLLSIAECGWLYKRIKAFVEEKARSLYCCSMTQSLRLVLEEFLADYSRAITTLESRIHQIPIGFFDDYKNKPLSSSKTSLSTSPLTFITLQTFVNDCIDRMTFLAEIVDSVKGKKGGSILSAIWLFHSNGNVEFRNITDRMLQKLCTALQSLCLNWLVEGELTDAFGEFFIRGDFSVRPELLWHSRYSLREEMIPIFLDSSTAEKILIIGKSVNFLRQICNEKNDDFIDERLLKSLNTSALYDTDSSFKFTLNKIYRSMSCRVLRILRRKFLLNHHLKAMRRYLLLGQGDFIRYLMDMLEDSLNQSASELYIHNVSSILDSAVEATNAQFDHSDVLARLDVKLHDASPGDTGWDVFSLTYHCDGPIGASILSSDSLICYLRIFNFLWRSKRMEYSLTKHWIAQFALSKKLRQYPELNEALGSLMHTFNAIHAQMLHCTLQIQHYINFEVIQSHWNAFVRRFHRARDLDEAINEHKKFLSSALHGCFLGSGYENFHTQLRALFDLIIQFRGEHMQFCEAVSTAMNELDDKRLQLTTEEEDSNGISQENNDAFSPKIEDIISSLKIDSKRVQLLVSATSFKRIITDFLIMLKKQSDENLRFLSLRLDSNSYYAHSDPRFRKRFHSATSASAAVSTSRRLANVRENTKDEKTQVVLTAESAMMEADVIVEENHG